MTNRLPDVIGIGVRRCGSSWIHAVLNSHPDIGKPKSGLHFFSQNEERGLNWYTNEMKPFVDRKLLIEFSVSYLYPEYCHIAAARIRQLVPDASLFLCVRNPVERAYSDYLRSIRVGEIEASISFEEVIEKQPVYLDRSRYASLLEPYLDSFPIEKIKVLLYEDLESDPIEFAGNLSKFLSLPPTFDLDVLNRAEPKGKTVRSQLLSNTIRGVKSFTDLVAIKFGAIDQWSNWKGRHAGAYERALDLTYRKQDLDKSLLKQLTGEFSADVKCIEMLTGRILKGWHGNEKF
jgi:hypothetical protein